MPIRQEASAGCSILRFQLVSCLIDPVRFPMARLAAYVLACGLLIAGAMRPDASSPTEMSKTEAGVSLAFRSSIGFTW